MTNDIRKIIIMSWDVRQDTTRLFLVSDPDTLIQIKSKSREKRWNIKEKVKEIEDEGEWSNSVLYVKVAFKPKSIYTLELVK